MSKARVYARNLTANWVGYGANLVVMFFMSPFVVHRLGDTQYGIWSLLMSLTGYLGLAELGTRAGLGRYINFYLGKEDISKVNGVINTALAMFCVAGILLIAVAGGLSALVGTLFPKIPPSMLPDARIVVLLIALNLWLSFLSAAFRQILTAHERFDLLNAVDLGVLAVRTGGTIAVLFTGRGLVQLAAVQVAGSLLGILASYVLSRRVFPRLLLRPALASRERFLELFGFSIWAFVSSIGMRLLYTTDIIVIAMLLGPKQVTYYAIAGMLIMRARGLVGQVGGVFGPGMVQDCAREDWRSLRIVLRKGSTLVMAVAIPILVGLIAFGREFILLWMGPEYTVAYPVLFILAASQFPAFAFSLTGPIFRGLNRVRLAASLVFTQGVINLGLTLLFVMGFNMGINGVAWGTFFPRVTFAVMGGVLAMRWIQLRPKEFVSSVLWRWLLLVGLFSAVCACVAGLPWDAQWDRFCMKVGIALAAYLPLTWVILLAEDDRHRLRLFTTARLGGRLRPPRETVTRADEDSNRR